MENKTAKKVVVFEGKEDVVKDINVLNMIDDASADITIEEFNSAEEAFCYELASNYYDRYTEKEQYKGLAEAFMNEDHLIDESVVMDTVQAFKQM